MRRLQLGAVLACAVGLVGCGIGRDTRTVVHEMTWKVQPGMNGRAQTLVLHYRNQPDWSEHVHADAAVSHVQGLGKAVVRVVFEASYSFDRYRGHRIVEIDGLPSEPTWGGATGCDRCDGPNPWE